MLSGARIQAAIELLAEIEARPRPAEAIIRSYFRKRRYAGSRDRRSIKEYVYNILRRQARLDWRLANSTGGSAKVTPRERIIAYLAVSDGFDSEKIKSLFSGEGYSPSPLSNAEQVISTLKPPLEDNKMPPWVKLEFPEWLEGRLSELFGENLPGEMRALNLEAPVDLRVNTMKAARDEILDKLENDGINARATTLSPIGIRLSKHLNLESIAEYRDGTLEIQDEGSQLIALLCDVDARMTVVDYCAGGGGKTLALASLMNGRGRVYASDISEQRMKGMDERLRRANPGNVRKHVIGSESDELSSLKGAADRVLVDVPCTSSGAWRRHPEAKWSLDTDALNATTKEQYAIIEKAETLVKPGGRLIYATCSLLREENEIMIEKFLDRHDDFRTLSINEIWPRTIGGNAPVSGPYLRTSPATTDTDGFFAAILEKSA